MIRSAKIYPDITLSQEDQQVSLIANRYHDFLVDSELSPEEAAMWIAERSQEIKRIRIMYATKAFTQS
jgi:hypothetical protein